MAIPIVALVVLIGVALGGDGDGAEEGGAETTIVSTTDAPPTTETSPTTEASPTTETPSTTEVSPTTEPPATTLPLDDAEPTCGYVGTDDFDDIQVELLLTNPLGAVPSLDVTLTLEGGDDVRFATASESIRFPLAEERFRIEADTFTKLPSGIDEAAITCNVLAIDEGFGDMPALPGPGDVCEFVEIDDFGDIQVELDVTSPFTTTEDIDIHYALRGPGDVRFADSFASVEFVGAGATIRVSEDTVTDPPSWVGTDITCGILGFEAN
jgi:hypothetical protein